MTVKELIEQLWKFPIDMKVVVPSPEIDKYDTKVLELENVSVDGNVIKLWPW